MSAFCSGCEKFAEFLGRLLEDVAGLRMQVGAETGIAAVGDLAAVEFVEMGDACPGPAVAGRITEGQHDLKVGAELDKSARPLRVRLALGIQGFRLHAGGRYRAHVPRDNVRPVDTKLRIRLPEVLCSRVRVLEAEDP